MDMLPLIKRRRVSGQMEGLTVAEGEHQVCFKEGMIRMCEWVASYNAYGGVQSCAGVSWDTIEACTCTLLFVFTAVCN